MTRSVVFQTPGQLDIRAITVFGINAKPNSNSPIGFFGTGLKYAIAVLVREYQDVRLHIGHRTYRFYTKEQDFRDKTFAFIYMDRSDRTFFKETERLPFTTELGKTWELWQAFRELHSNTLDEGGETTLQISQQLDNDFENPEYQTIFDIRGEAFVQEYLEKDKTFLPGGLRQQETSESMQTFLKPSKHVYYRGMRVMDLPDPAALTYNILRPIDLTEDRTAKFPHLIEGMIREHIATKASADEVYAAIRAPKDSYEGRISYAYTYECPSSTFVEVVRANPKEVNPSALELVKTYVPTQEETAAKEEPFADKLTKCLKEERWDDFLELCKNHTSDVISLIDGSFF